MGVSRERSVVALFGTYDSSSWRDRFIARYDELGITYYNPIGEKRDIAAEVVQLSTAPIVLLPITSDSTGFESLVEVGFAAGSLHLNPTRTLVTYIAPTVSQSVRLRDLELADASNRARKLAIAHLAYLKSPQIILVNDLTEMLMKSIELCGVKNS